MREIDEFSEALGALRGDIKAHSALHSIIINKLDKIDDKLNGITDSNKDAHSRIADLEAEAVTKTGVMKIIIGGGVASGLSGAGLWTALKAFLAGQ